MARIDGGEMLVRMLQQEGIDTLFALHGGHLDPIFQAAVRHDMRLVDTRHEQAAGHAADGWARTTGQTGVAVVTAGPGLTDCVTAIANAYLDCIPTLFITGAAPLVEAETLPLQGGIDQVAVVEPITKWAHRITHTSRIPDLVAQGLRMARSGRPGPVLLELPVDVLFAREDEASVTAPVAAIATAPAAPAGDAIDAAIELLASAERPLIYAGGGAWFSGAGPELVSFAERTGIPVFMNSKARGMMPASHPLCGGSFSIARAGLPTSARTDCLLILGARLGLFTGGRRGGVIPPDATAIQVDIAPEEIGRNRDIQLGIAADCRQSLRLLEAAATEREWPDWSSWQASVATAARGPGRLFADEVGRVEAPIHPYRLAHDVVTAIPPDTIVTVDGGETSTWLDMVGAPESGGTWLSHGYLGCLGTGLPFAIAAQIAHPDRRVVCVIGDGSVGLNFAEFDTMVRHALPIVTVVNNDQLWGMSAHGQDLVYGEENRVVTELGPVRYDLAAAGFGCHGELVEEPGEIGPAIERALASGRPACVNVMTDSSVISPVTRAMVGGAADEATDDDGRGDGREGSIRVPYYDDIEG